MPGEERKFKRRRILAFAPTCNCEREMALHRVVSAGISTMGVGNDSGTGNKVGDGMIVDVAVGAIVGDDVGATVSVSGMDVEEAETTVEGGGGVDVSGMDAS